MIQEAGLDGFWLHRLLEASGIESHVVDPASIAVDRRKRRRKTDAIDVDALLRTLMAWARGERRVCSMVRPSSPEDEDRRRLSRGFRQISRQSPSKPQWLVSHGCGGATTSGGLARDLTEPYAESKLQVVALAFALARRWPGVLSNAVDPGWVRTRMGGAGAPVDLETGARTQSWLAVSEETEAKVSGRYWHHQRQQTPAGEATEPAFQDQLLERLAELAGITLPADAASASC